MLAFRTILPDTLELLRGLMACPLLDGTRLVGGTALALQYGHRQSVDLDMFGRVACDEEELREALKRIGEVKVLKESANIKVYMVNGIKVDVVNYSYPWIREALTEDGLRLAAPEDIAAMKVNAIEGRGSKKDFIDIFALLQRFGLDEILGFYREKYPDHSMFRALMSLTYFEDANPQQMPKMFIETEWEEMKTAITQAVQESKGR